MAKIYRKNIIFTHSKLTGTYRYKDKFQIYPLNIERAPRSIYAEELPCCIEYYYLEEDIVEAKPFKNKYVDEMVTASAAETNKRNKILNLLSSITNFRFKLDGKINMVWSVTLPEDFKENPEELNKSSSRNSMEGYMYPGIGKDLSITEFSNIPNQPILLLDHKQYYLFDPIDDNDQTIKFPTTIDRIIEKYFALDDTSSQIIDSAAFQDQDLI